MIMLTLKTLVYVVIYHRRRKTQTYIIWLKTFQMHYHSKTCRKYKNMTCRFKFGLFATEKKQLTTQSKAY